MKMNRRFLHWTFVIGSFALFVFPESRPVLAQSTDETRPTAVAGFPVSGNLGRGTYYYSVPATRGRINMTLEFTPPDGGGGMSVSISGPSCCTAEAYVGADSGTPDPVRRETSFEVGSNQTLLITSYIAVADRRTVRFNLNMTGSVGAADATAIPRVCTDLSASSLMEITRSILSHTIKGSIDNLSTTDFRSPADRQWVEVYDTSLDAASPTLVQRIPFTEVQARRRFRFTARHNTGKTRRVDPIYRVVIVYSPLNRSDDVTTNDDCNAANNTAVRRPTATL